MFNKDNNQQGQSLIELMVAMGIFVLIVSSIMFLTLDAHSANRQGEERTRAALLAQETHEAATSIANQGWRSLVDGEYGIDHSSGVWDFSMTPNVIDSTFVRKVTVESVERNGAGDIVDTGGTIDFDTKKLTTSLTWDFTTARPSAVTVVNYLTNWQSSKWVQTTQADFDQGILTDVITTATGDGEIELAQGSTTGSYNWSFDVPADYSYDPLEIEVVSSQARLINLGTGRSTSNATFDVNDAGWTASTWDKGPGDPNASGSWGADFGQTGGGIQLNIPKDKRYQAGGYYEQGFTISNAGPSYIDLSFAWSVSAYDPDPQLFEVFAFVDSTSDEPFSGTEVWSSGPLSSTTGWSTENIDLSGILTTPGTYYVKLAVWAEVGSQRRGAFAVRFDDASVQWDGGQSSYSDSSPTVEPINSFSSTDILSWLDFEETAAKDGGEIYYQLSDDGGATWLYWRINRWRSADATDYTTAADVSTHIADFSAAAQQILFRAFLVSDGTQYVVLDRVRVSYETSGGGGYATLGTFVSSALDTSTTDPVYNYLTWTASEPVGAAVQFQVRTADSQTNLSGATWVGPGGLSSAYYTTPGTIIDTDPLASGTRWVQYWAELTSDGTVTPIISDVTIDYEP